MLNSSTKNTAILYSGVMKAVDLVSLCLIWLGLQLMVVIAEAVSTKSTD